jgi:hypothetical protein
VKVAKRKTTNPNGFQFWTIDNPQRAIRSFALPNSTPRPGIGKTPFSNHNTLQFTQSINLNNSIILAVSITNNNLFQ